ncbi:TREHALOSE-PHOSPHATE PHOSPHATASE A [Salix viminalis]|uniref:TREHALOSE-PHOSPHATE PHOSPHATASE A n=1 Tax=Salix viminalis TaxID=40686 RepID=A0A9Q0SFU9_SALVM|nr:TREHALOSE-PHOSPHATE PHOSPHATASE A [Salix viminalis]
MDLKSSHGAPVLTDSAPLSKSRLGGHHGLLPYSPSGAPFSKNLRLSIPKKKLGFLDDVRSIGWLDAMKSSSPPHKTFNKDSNIDLSSPDPEAASLTWLLKFPSALASFEQIANFAKGKRIALFLDYDGTLSPIVENPDNAFMSDDVRIMRSAVKNVAKYFPTAIISGRSRDKVYEFVGLTELYYAGSHGMDIASPVRQSICDDDPHCIKSTDTQGNEVNLFQPAREFLPVIDEVFSSLVKIGECVEDVIKKYEDRLRLTQGRKVLEIRPKIDWDKGKALVFLLESLGEQLFTSELFVLRDRNCGYGILVSKAPKESDAYYSLRDPSEVMEFLKSLVTWKQSSVL